MPAESTMKNGGYVVCSACETFGVRSRGTKLSSWLHLKVAHIVGIHFQRFLPWHIERLLLNKRVLDVLRLRRLCKDRAGVYSADTPLRHLCFMILRRRVRRELEIFYV